MIGGLDKGWLVFSAVSCLFGEDSFSPYGSLTSRTDWSC